MSTADEEVRRMATTENVLDMMEDVDSPVVTAPEVAEEFDITQQAAYEKLRRLNSTGEIKRKKVGAKAVVWFLDRNYSLPINSSET